MGGMNHHGVVFYCFTIIKVDDLGVPPFLETIYWGARCIQGLGPMSGQFPLTHLICCYFIEI